MPYVGVGLRAVATIIDTVLVFLAGYLIAAAAGTTTEGGFHLAGGPLLLWIVLGIGYYTVMEATTGATLGKLAVGLRVVKLEGGGPIDWRDAVVRNVLRLVDGFMFYLVGAILVWSSPNRQRLGDRVAGTAVLRAATKGGRS
jgi:uncharacterized RDD family membrane protein YckC